MPKGERFQIKIQGQWKDYDTTEDKLLKCGFMSGVPILKLKHHGNLYEYDFKQCQQRNVSSGRMREIRPPHKWKAPSQPVVPASKMTTIKLTAGQPGKVICLRHPSGGSYTIKVPASAREGQTMLVPVPENAMDASELARFLARCECGKTTGSKVAIGLGGAVAAAAIGGGAAISSDMIAGGLEEVPEYFEDAFDDVAGWTMGAGDAIADFIIDLF